MSDNRLFNVNGENSKTLKLAIKLAFMIDSYSEEGNIAKAYRVDPNKGLIFLWTSDTTGAIPFKNPLHYKDAFKFALEWLSSPEATNIKLEHWEEDVDHDGSNSIGWRVYLEDWGHVGDERYAICAVKPCYLWYGK